MNQRNGIVAAAVIALTLAGGTRARAEIDSAPGLLDASGIGTMTAIRSTLRPGTSPYGADRGTVVVTTRPSAALTRLERAALSGRRIRALRLSDAGGKKRVELRDVTVAGWTLAEEGSTSQPETVDIRFTYDRAE